MKQMLVRVNDKSRLDELKQYGIVRSVPKYSSVLRMDCFPNKIVSLSTHPIVESCSEVPVGNVADK